jgi:hypothetical protein
VLHGRCWRPEAHLNGDQGKWQVLVFRGARGEVRVVHDGAIGGYCFGAVFSLDAGGASIIGVCSGGGLGDA